MTVSKVAIASIVFASLLFVEAVFAEDLFKESHRPISADEEREIYDDRSIIRSRRASLDTALLIGSAAAGEPVDLNLFRDVELRAAFDQPVRPSSSGGAFMYGRLERGGHATLFVGEGGIVRGEVHSSRGIYTIRNSKGRAGVGGDVTIRQIDAARLPVVDHGADLREQIDRAGYSAARSTIEGSDEEEVEEPSDETVDLLVVYTPGAEAHEGGKAEIEATIAAEVEKTNQAFENSDLGHRTIRLVAMKKVNHTESTDHLGTDKDFLSARKGDDNGYDPDGVLDEVHSLRERLGADLVHFVVKESRITCGVASIYTLNTEKSAEHYCRYEPEPDREECIHQKLLHEWLSFASFSISAIPEGCTVRHVFTHELGHNLTIYHDRYSEKNGLSLTDPIRFPLKPYGFGYVNQNFGRPKCRLTVMASGKECADEGFGPGTGIKELRFSNPDLEFGSEEEGFDPAGVPGEEWTVELDGPVNAARAIDDVWDIVANLHSLTETGHAVPFMPAAGGSRQGFVRVLNHSNEAGEVTIEAFDDAGDARDPVSFDIDAGETAHFNSDDLEMGNPAKGLSGGVGAGEGDWRLKLTSLLDIEVLAYVRTEDGFLTAMHDLMPASGPGRRAAFFNPGSNESQVSLLRLANPREEEAAVAIAGVDDEGEAGGEVRVVVPARGAVTLTAGELERGGEGLEGALGDGAGKWRLFVEAEKVGTYHRYGFWVALPWILAMSLLESPTGHLTNLSTIPRNEYLGTHTVPLFPAKSAAGRQGFARVLNRSGEAGEATITADDDAGREYGPVTLALAANGAAHFNSDDLEDGNAAKGLSGGIGPGEGDWRLEVTSDLKIDVLAYVRTDDGFVTTMHDAAPSLIHAHRAPTFNPGSNADQASSLRLVNPGEEDAEVTIVGTDGDGLRTEEIRVTIPAKASRTLTSRELESGGIGFDGSLGDGAGKWELEIRADREIVAMSLLESPTGHLTNLSTAPVRGAGPWPRAYEEEEN